MEVDNIDAKLKTIQNVYLNNKDNLDFFTDSYRNNFNFEIDINNNPFPSSTGERKFSPMDRSLRRELKSAFGNNNYWFNTSKFKNAVDGTIKKIEDQDFTPDPEEERTEIKTEEVATLNQLSYTPCTRIYIYIYVLYIRRPPFRGCHQAAKRRLLSQINS